jgi:hypothetical protein
MQVITNAVSSLKSGHFHLGMEVHLQTNFRITKKTACTMLETAGSYWKHDCLVLKKQANMWYRRRNIYPTLVPYLVLRER